MKRKIRQFWILACVFSAVIYILYRGVFTLNFTGPYAALASLALYAAEMYGCLLMFMYFFQIWEIVEPEPVPIIEGRTVDVFIPSYNEDAHLLRGTIEAAKAMDYPHRTYLLDDGNRPEVKELCEELGVFYVTRKGNMHAKAGNLNNALDMTDGEFIIVFDADHIAQRNFITRIIGYFADDRLAFIQTPHCYYNYENFQGELNYDRDFYWEEGQLFYNCIQPGKNYWNGVSFCGSAAMFRRKALEEVGLIATETITEDMHTGLRMHTHGWRSLFINERLITGQAAPEAKTINTQRLRWGEGNLSIFAYDSPLTSPNITIAQRICYVGSTLSWTTGCAKVLLYITPIMMLLTGVAPVQDFHWAYAWVTLSYLFTTWIACKVASNGYGYLYGIELSAMTNFWIQCRATWKAIFNRKQQNFVVTAKRGTPAKKGEASVAWVVMPQILLIVAGFIAITWAGARYYYGMSHDTFGLGVGSALILLHSWLAWVVIRRAYKSKDIRFSWRHPCDSLHVRYEYTDDEGNTIVGQGVSTDMNECGLGFIAYKQIPQGKRITVTMRGGGRELTCFGEVRNARTFFDGQFGRHGRATGVRYGLQFVDLTGDQLKGLWFLSIHYVVHKSYDEFERARLRKQHSWGVVLPWLWAWLFPAPEKTRLPITMTQGDKTYGTVLEELDHLRAVVLLEYRPVEGEELAFDLGMPFAEVKGVAIPRNPREVIDGDRTMWKCDLLFDRFDDQGRSRVHSLAHIRSNPNVKTVLAFRPKQMGEPFLEPAKVALMPSLICAVLLFSVFQWINYEQILIDGLIAGRTPSISDESYIQANLERTLAYPALATPDHVVRLRSALIAMGKIDDAAQLAGILVKLAPSDVYARIAWADHLVKQKKLAEAEKEMDELMAQIKDAYIDPEAKVQVLLNAARNSVNVDKKAVGAERFKSYLTYRPQDNKVRKEYAGVLLSLKRTDEAIDALKDAPLDLETRYLLVTIYTVANNFKEAERICYEILDAAPDDLKAQELLADLATWQKQYVSAIEEYRGLLANNPHETRLQLKLGRALLWNAADHRETVGGDYNDRGGAWVSGYSEALHYLAPLVAQDVRLNGPLATNSVNVAMTATQEGRGRRPKRNAPAPIDVQARKAEATLQEERLHLWEDYIDAAVGAGALTTADLHNMEQWYTAAATGQLKYVPLLARLGEAYYRHGDPRKAVELLERCVALEGKNTDVRLRLADILHELKEFDRADYHYQVLLAEKQLHGDSIPTGAEGSAADAGVWLSTNGSEERFSSNRRVIPVGQQTVPPVAPPQAVVAPQTVVAPQPAAAVRPQATPRRDAESRRPPAPQRPRSSARPSSTARN